MPQLNSLDDIVEGCAQVEKVLSGFEFTEGPVFSRLGYLLFTDIPRNAPPEDGKVGFSAVYQIRAAHGSSPVVRLATREMDRPNGVALSANQLTLFVADSERQNVRAYDVAADGSLTRGRVAAETWPGGIITGRSTSRRGLRFTRFG